LVVSMFGLRPLPAARARTVAGRVPLDPREQRNLQLV
jgi:hypothetical protein